VVEVECYDLASGSESSSEVGAEPDECNCEIGGDKFVHSNGVVICLKGTVFFRSGRNVGERLAAKHLVMTVFKKMTGGQYLSTKRCVLNSRKGCKAGW